MDRYAASPSIQSLCSCLYLVIFYFGPEKVDRDAESIECQLGTYQGCRSLSRFDLCPVDFIKLGTCRHFVSMAHLLCRTSAASRDDNSIRGDSAVPELTLRPFQRHPQI